MISPNIRADPENLRWNIWFEEVEEKGLDDAKSRSFVAGSSNQPPKWLSRALWSVSMTMFPFVHYLETQTLRKYIDVE